MLPLKVEQSALLIAGLYAAGVKKGSRRRPLSHLHRSTGSPDTGAVEDVRPASFRDATPPQPPAIRSTPPMYGHSTRGIRMEPSAC